MPLLVLQAYGHIRELRRATFCILSYVAHMPAEGDKPILLFTDQPDFFRKAIPELNIEFSLLTPGRIRDMRGAIDFTHRMKIAMIEEAFRRKADQLWYVDSDTFFLADPSPFLARVNPGSSFMHTREHAFAFLESIPLPGGAPFQAFYRLITSKSFRLTSGESINVSPQLFSWNAGAMFFHPAHAAVIPDVYALTDQFYPETRNHASEQYAFSIMLQLRTTVEALESIIYHYWYRIKKDVMDELLARDMTDDWMNLTLEQKSRWTRHWTGLLPEYMERHVFSLRDHAIQSFHEGRYGSGYRYALRALMQDPMDKEFIRHLLYHTKQLLFGPK